MDRSMGPITTHSARRYKRPLKDLSPIEYQLRKTNRQRTEAPQPIPEQLAHRHQPQGIPARMTRHRELPQIRAQTLLALRDIHTFHLADDCKGGPGCLRWIQPGEESSGAVPAR